MIPKNTPMMDPSELVDVEVAQPSPLPAQTGEAAPLANRKAPFYINKQERPAHRLALEYAAKGYDIKEIAKMLGYTEVAVNNWLRQPYAQQTLVNTIQRNVSVDDQVVKIIKDNVVASMELYQSILRDPNADRKDRMEAAERFLNRRYGKPTQPMSQGSVVDLNNLSDEELAAMLPTQGTGTNA